jgi:hypothetical protein
MLRSTLKILALLALLIAASAGVAYYTHQTSASRTIEKLQDEKRELEKVVTRLNVENRVADILVSSQDREANGTLYTTLLFVEYDKRGEPLPAKSFTIEGDTAHLDAMVIKFEHDFIAKDDPLRGHSIALFTKLYGEKQRPADGYMIDSPGKIPDIYRGADPKVSQFELSLWSDFWKLYEDEEYRKSKGVALIGGASGNSVWGPFKPDRLYTITVGATGQLAMTSALLKGVYREALRQRSAATQPGIY